MAKGELLFLGTGGSTGIPMVGCSCVVCTSKDPQNKRLRPSVLLSVLGKKLLIDTTPDFRTQALTYKLTHIDGVLYTHSHYDHISGLDELRAYYLLKGQVVPVLLSKATFEEIKTRYAYLFKEKSLGKSLSAQLSFTELTGKRGEVIFEGVPIQYLTYTQANMEVVGYRVGDLAYLTDLQEYDETLFDDLVGVNTLIVSALRHTPSPVHLTVEQAVAFGKRSGAKKVYFTHMAHELDHKQTNKNLPEGFALAHDGLTCPFTLL